MSAIMITNKTGTVVKEKKYEAFGSLIWEEGTHDDNREFTGKEKDPTGFHYFGARYYSGDIGRFLSPDPHTLYPGNIDLSNPQELNPYVYCVNNPVQYKDPDGKYYVDSYTGQAVKPNTVYESSMALMPAILGGEDVWVPFHKGRTTLITAFKYGISSHDVLYFGSSTKLDNSIAARGYTKIPFMQYKASSSVVGTKLECAGVEFRGKEFGTGKNVLQLTITATKSLGGVSLEGKESMVKGEGYIQENVIILTGTEEKLGEQLNDWGYELYRDEEKENSWGIR